MNKQITQQQIEDLAIQFIADGIFNFEHYNNDLATLLEQQQNNLTNILIRRETGIYNHY